MKPLMERIASAGPFKVDDAKALQGLLENKVLQRALAEVARESEAVAQQMMTAQLESEEGRLQCIRKQGLGRGLLRALDILDELQHKES